MWIYSKSLNYTLQKEYNGKYYVYFTTTTKVCTLLPAAPASCSPCSTLLVAPALPSNSATAPGLQGGGPLTRARLLSASVPQVLLAIPPFHHPSRGGAKPCFSPRSLCLSTLVLWALLRISLSRSLRHCLNAELYIVLYQRLHV